MREKKDTQGDMIEGTSAAISNHEENLIMAKKDKRILIPDDSEKVLDYPWTAYLKTSSCQRIISVCLNHLFSRALLLAAKCNFYVIQVL